MTDHPSTFRGEDVPSGMGWDEAAQLHLSNDGGGVFSALKTVRSGTLAELIHFVIALPESERAGYTIEKKGDHRLSSGEIAALARRPDFPA
jgi:hypothetical protein